jgi:general stress protein YciG
MASTSNSGGTGRKGRGFASMDKDRQREIASEGGRAAHQSGNAHEFTSEEARRAGQQSHRARQKNSSSGSSKSDSEGGAS